MQDSRIARRAFQVASVVTLFASTLVPALAGAQIVQAGAPRAANGNAARDSTARDSVAADSAAAPQSTAPAIRRPPAILNLKDVALAAGFTAGAVALFPLDQRFTRWMRATPQQENGFLSGTMAGAEAGLEVGAQVVSGGLYVAGLVTRNRTLADMGFHSLAAVLVSQQTTALLKNTFGRARPYASGDSVAHDFQWGGGFSDGTDRRSFPSGHTSHAFAFATAMSHEINRAWPRAGKVASPMLYAGATAVGLARVYHDKHWASDVALGAGIGILSARTTLRFLHARPNNFLDRIAFIPTVVPNANGGANIGVAIPTP